MLISLLRDAVAINDRVARVRYDVDDITLIRDNLLERIHPDVSLHELLRILVLVALLSEHLPELVHVELSQISFATLWSCLSLATLIDFHLLFFRRTILRIVLRFSSLAEQA